MELADGRRVALAECGDRDGAPLVVLHGFPDSRLTGRVFDEAGRRRGVRVLAPDRPGIGGSTGRLASLGDCAGWLDALADALELGRFPLLGISGGGPFTLACARFLPGRLERAVVVAGLGPPEHGYAGMAPGQRLGIAVAQRAPGLAAAVLSATGLLARRRPGLFLALVRLHAGAADARIARGSEAVEAIAHPYAEGFRGGRAGIARELELLLRPWGFRPEEIEIPVHFVHGTDDRTVPASAARSLAGRVPGAELTLRPGLGHFSLVGDDPDRLLALAGR